MSSTGPSYQEAATQVHSAGKQDWRLTGPLTATMSSNQGYQSSQPQIQGIHAISGRNQQSLVHQQPRISPNDKSWHIAWITFHILSIVFCAVAIGTSASLSNNRDAEYGWLITVCAAPPV